MIVKGGKDAFGSREKVEVLRTLFDGYEGVVHLLCFILLVANLVICLQIMVVFVGKMQFVGVVWVRIGDFFVILSHEGKEYCL